MKKIKKASLILLLSYLIRNDNIYKKNFTNKYKSLKNYFTNKKLYNQLGGSDEIIVNYNDEAFTFIEYEPNNWTLYSIDDYDCISISIDSELSEASINNINADTVKCGETIMTNQGSHLFKIGLQFLKENKKRFNINKIKLTDTASKLCNNTNIYLKIFLTLLTGHTWYGKYGFRPIKRDERKHYRYNRNKLNEIKLNDINFNKILDKLLKYKNKKEITNDQYDYFINIYNKLKSKNPLIKDLLYEIFRKDKYDLICNIFNKIYPKIVALMKLKIDYLNAKTSYELDL